MTDIALQVDQTRAEGRLGASDAGAVLGLDRWRSPMDIWLRETSGETKDVPPSVAEAAAFGTLLEPIVRGKYAIDRGVSIAVPRMSSLFEDWLRATPDGFVVADTLAPGTFEVAERPNVPIAGLLQVKCRSAYASDEWERGVPAAEEVQCRVEMAVTGLGWNDCAVLLGGNRMLVHRIERDLKLEARILGELHAFWELVQSKTSPDVDGSAAWRDFASSRMRPTKVAIAADESTVDLLAEWKRLRSEREALEQAEAEIKTSLLLKMSAAGATKITAGIGDVSAYLAGGRTDYKAWAMELAKGEAVPERFKKPSTTWALKVPKQWSDDDDTE